MKHAKGIIKCFDREDESIFNCYWNVGKKKPQKFIIISLKLVSLKQSGSGIMIKTNNLFTGGIC